MELELQPIELEGVSYQRNAQLSLQDLAVLRPKNK